MANNRECICCGRKYYYCNTCSSSSKNTGISMVYDTVECQELTNAISGYSMKIWDKDKIADVLKKYNITDYTKYKESIQKQLNELFPVNEKKETKIVKETKEKEAKEVKETKNERNENGTAEDKPRKKRKSRSKKVVLSDETVEHSESN